MGKRRITSRRKRRKSIRRPKRKSAGNRRITSRPRRKSASKFSMTNSPLQQQLVNCKKDLQVLIHINHELKEENDILTQLDVEKQNMIDNRDNSIKVYQTKIINLTKSKNQLLRELDNKYLENQKLKTGHVKKRKR